MPRKRTIAFALLFAGVAAVAWITQAQEAGAAAAGEAPNAGWLTLLPPVLAIAMALVFRQVVPALFAGIWVGAWIVYGDPFSGLLRTIDKYAVGSLADTDHTKIVLFTLLLGGMVGVISKSGGTRGLVNAIAPYATNSRRGQVVTWMLGIVVFFDDYANTLLVGNTMRPVTDKLRISREKLAYIVDSTAAPVASIALVSTWIGYEISLIGEALKKMGDDTEPYAIFLQSLPYNFYPVLALVFGIMVATTLRDFGPMLKAERRAAGGKVLRDGAVPLADFEGKALAPPEGKPERWINAAIPVGLVLVVTFAALWFTGRASLVAADDPTGSASIFSLGMQGLGAVFSAGASYDALMYAALTGSVSALVLAVGQGIFGLGTGLTAWIDGMKSMMTAMVILILAWGIGAVCADLKTADFLVGQLSDTLNPGLVPALIFILASITAFSTGTSWATMSILIPLAVPTAVGVAQSAGWDDASAHGIMLGAVSAVLAGALFGDHCSPISDTTVMSSMSSGCDHVDHVRTQLPYALTVAGIALIAGYIPVGFGLSPWLGLLIGSGLLYGVLRVVGRRATD
jgi:Na+/H+ antiporter NhaC